MKTAHSVLYAEGYEIRLRGVKPFTLPEIGQLYIT